MRPPPCGRAFRDASWAGRPQSLHLLPVAFNLPVTEMVEQILRDTGERLDPLAVQPDTWSVPMKVTPRISMIDVLENSRTCVGEALEVPTSLALRQVLRGGFPATGEAHQSGRSCPDQGRPEPPVLLR